MASIYQKITPEEMHDFLSPQGFKVVEIEGTREIVYSKSVMENVYLRVHTSIDGTMSLNVGKDAIRVTLVCRLEDGTIKGAGRTKQIHRIGTWRNNLQQRIDQWAEELLGPFCPKCNSIMVSRIGKWGEFFGCIHFPACRGSVKWDGKN
jgi:hypothetical protein